MSTISDCLVKIGSESDLLLITGLFGTLCRVLRLPAPVPVDHLWSGSGPTIEKFFLQYKTLVMSKCTLAFFIVFAQNLWEVGQKGLQL